MTKHAAHRFPLALGRPIRVMETGVTGVTDGTSFSRINISFFQFSSKHSGQFQQSESGLKPDSPPGLGSEAKMLMKYYRGHCHAFMAWVLILTVSLEFTLFCVYETSTSPVFSQALPLQIKEVALISDCSHVLLRPWSLELVMSCRGA